MGIEQKIQWEVPYLWALRNAHNVEEKIMQCPLPQASVPGVGLIFRVLWDLPTARKSEKDCLTFEDAKRYKEELRKAGELLGISHILNIKIEVYEK